MEDFILPLTKLLSSLNKRLSVTSNIDEMTRSLRWVGIKLFIQLPLNMLKDLQKLKFDIL